MGLEIVVSTIELPPVRTTANVEPAKENYPVGGKNCQEEQCTTPKLAEHVDDVKPRLVCPPTPKKRRLEAVKRKIPQDLFVSDVPTDLASIFVPRQPPTKRIRVALAS